MTKGRVGWGYRCGIVVEQSVGIDGAVVHVGHVEHDRHGVERGSGDESKGVSCVMYDQYVCMQ